MSHAYGVDLRLFHGVLLEAIEVGEGAVECGRGHVAMRWVGVHSGLRGGARGKRGGQR
jgi:hypothetical protein